MVKIAIDLSIKGMIDEKTALNRIEPNKLVSLLYSIKKRELAKVWKRFAGFTGCRYRTDSYSSLMMPLNRHADGKKVVMVRTDILPEDLAGMAVAEGILTARGGMTSHAAVCSSWYWGSAAYPVLVP